MSVGFWGGFGDPNGGTPPQPGDQLPPGAKWVYKALGLEVPEGDGSGSPFPPYMFEDELRLAALALKKEYPRTSFPCLYNSAGQIDPANADDALLYQAALGLWAASLLVGGDSGAPGVGAPVMVKRKLLDVEYTFKDVDPTTLPGKWRTLAGEYMESVSCVGGDASGILGYLQGGLLVGANPNTDATGHLVDNRNVPLEAGFPYSLLGTARRERLP